MPGDTTAMFEVDDTGRRAGAGGRQHATDREATDVARTRVRQDLAADSSGSRRHRKEVCPTRPRSWHPGSAADCLARNARLAVLLVMRKLLLSLPILGACNAPGPSAPPMPSARASLSD